MLWVVIWCQTLGDIIDICVLYDKLHKHDNYKRSTLLISPQIETPFLFMPSWFSTPTVYMKHSWMKCSFTVNPTAACQLCATQNPLQSLFWLVRGGKWLSGVLSEVNVHGLHSRVLGVMTEEVPQGERLFAAISLSLFLTTRLPQQMAPMLTLRNCEAMRNCVGWSHTKMCSESQANWFEWCKIG